MKRWFQSKTHWFNISMGLSWIGIFLTYLNDFGFEPRTTAVLGIVLGVLQSVGNGYLRQITDTGIGDGGPVDEYDGQF